MSHSGHTFSVRRMQTHDGPGLRTTVFMKGCSLHCAWCHNPEALSPAREVWWLRDQCIGSLDCIGACPNTALELTEAGMRIDRNRCDGCYECVDACPARAMEALRRDWSLDDLLREVKRDQPFFRGKRRRSHRERRGATGPVGLRPRSPGGLPGEWHSRWEICTFNPLGAQKYRRLNKDWFFEDSSLMVRDEARKLHSVALRQSSLPSDRVILKGRTQ